MRGLLNRNCHAIAVQPPAGTRSDLFPVAAAAATVIGTVIWLVLMKVVGPTVMPVVGVTLAEDPVMVTVAVALRASTVGDTELITGAGGVIVKVTVLLVPPAVVTETACAPVVAVEAMTNVAETDLAVEVEPVTVIPAGTLTTAPVRLEPDRVTWTLAPCAPDVGVITRQYGRRLIDRE